MTPFPRVTEILAAVGLGPDFSGVPPATLEAARTRGTLVHAVIEADHYGFLEGEPDPVVAPYLDAYRKFLAESKHEPLASEIEVRHETWRYRGHPDRLGWLLGARVILDWKTAEAVDLVPAGYQLAAYRLAWNAMHPTEPVAAIAVVQLKRDGTYRLHEVVAADAEPIFLAATVVYHARSKA